MGKIIAWRNISWLMTPIVLGASLSSCASKPVLTCTPPQERNLDVAIQTAQQSLASGCETQFDNYLAELLSIAEEDPNLENKRRFSEFLVWASDQGLLSNRQAQASYNRYFNMKFVSMRGDYNNCADTCLRKQLVLTSMEEELADKERGLLRISLDNDGYYRADRLFQETELVLEAMCLACAGNR